MTKISSLFLIAFTALIALGFVASSVFANEEMTYSPLVQKIAERFGLDIQEVQGVIDEHKASVMQKRDERHEDHLSQLVKDVVITEAQKEALLQKHEEMRERREALRGLTGDERREGMEQLRSEMEKWLKEQGLEDVLLFSEGKHMRMHDGM